MTKPSATSLLLPRFVESLTETSSQALETSKSVTKPSATSLLLPRFVESLTETSSQTLETSKSVTKPSATSFLSSSYVESLIETSSQSLETTKSEKISSATSFLLPSFVEPLTKTSSQTLETSKSVTKPSATSLLSPSVKISFSETSGQLMASITQVTKPLGTFSAIPTIVKSSAKPENYSMEVRIPSSLRTSFVASSYLGSSTRNGFQTLEISKTPSSSSTFWRIFIHGKHACVAVPEHTTGITTRNVLLFLAYNFCQSRFSGYRQPSTKNKPNTSGSKVFGNTFLCIKLC